MNNEKLVYIPGFDKRYSISSDGAIYSNISNKMLSVHTNNYGYKRVGLSTNGINKKYLVHRLVALSFFLDYSDKLVVDHIDGNKDNNSVSNLRMATISQNQANSCKQPNTYSKYKGVTWDKHKNMWTSFISQTINGKRKHIRIGLFTTEKDAALAYDKSAIEAFGDFAKTNEMLGLLY